MRNKLIEEELQRISKEMHLPTQQIDLQPVSSHKPTFNRTETSILVALALSLDNAICKVLHQISAANIWMRRVLATAFRITILKRNYYQCQALLQDHPWLIPTQDPEARKILLYSLQQSGIESQSKMLSFLVQAGLRIDENLHHHQALARTTDLEVLLGAGLVPFRGYIVNLVKEKNIRVLEALLANYSLRPKFMTAFRPALTAHCTTGANHGDIPSTKGDTVGDCIASSLLNVTYRSEISQPAPAQLLLDLLRTVEPKIGKLCYLCYIFCFHRGSAAFETIFDKSFAPSPDSGEFAVFRVMSQNAMQVSCEGPGLVVFAAIYERVTAGADLLLQMDHPRGHKNRAASLRWAMRFAVLHDDTDFIDIILYYDGTRSLKLSLGPDQCNIPSGLIPACKWRATSGSATPDQSKQRNQNPDPNEIGYATL